ncbi:hypothetical protein V502_01259 [Pseudogymnoascus sp. VKM F-4520 (FW-2644)]|nr:hypothetical protein V502_01259 [Pseudogymnoascus sp. VKM F-4520 (FW-2644)]
MSSYRRYPPPPPPPSTPLPLPCDRGPPPPPLVETPVTKLHCAIENAVADDDNVLVRITYPEQKLAFWSFLLSRKSEIERIVSHHLHVKTCQMGEVNTWISGSFNICIPVCIDQISGARVLIRIPLPYKIGEANNAGNVDEKLRCEAASYMWIQEDSPEIPIPKLFGCGFTDGQTFTTPEKVPFLPRLMWRVNRAFRSLLSLPTPSHYVGRSYPDTLNTGYLIMSYVTDGTMLSQSWQAHRHNSDKRSNLFHGLARIMFSLGKPRLPRIGSFTLDNRGIISLTNRPLTLRLQALENEGIDTDIRMDYTYSAVDLYLLDFLNCHNNRIYQQPNSVHNQDDGQQQVAALTMMKAVIRHFVNRDLRHGPFIFTLTDMHQSNIFVDDQWNITFLIDLEWACSLPVELQCPPYWLSGRSVDGMPQGEHLEAFGDMVAEFIKAFEVEESLVVDKGQPLFRSALMRKCWEAGSFWYFQAVNSPKGMYTIFNQHIQRIFCAKHCDTTLFDEVVSSYWARDVNAVIEKKLKEEDSYKEQLREAFIADPSLLDSAR